MSITTWRKEIEAEKKLQGDESDFVQCTLTCDRLDREFDDGFGFVQGEPFTAWTSDRVYFPVVYDGSEWVASAPRHPNDVPTEHIGGQ